MNRKNKSMIYNMEIREGESSTSGERELKNGDLPVEGIIIELILNVEEGEVAQSPFRERREENLGI